MAAHTHALSGRRPTPSPSPSPPLRAPVLLQVEEANLHDHFQVGRGGLPACVCLCAVGGGCLGPGSGEHEGQAVTAPTPRSWCRSCRPWLSTLTAMQAGKLARSIWAGAVRAAA
jgi:hypothetical protein